MISLKEHANDRYTILSWLYAVWPHKEGGGINDG